MLPEVGEEELFTHYEARFKALADAQRLKIMNVLVKHGRLCVGDLACLVNMTQSKLSYHLKILLDVNLLHVETCGKWNYYWLNQKEVQNIMSEELCCLFRPDSSA